MGQWRSPIWSFKSASVATESPAGPFDNGLLFDKQREAYIDNAERTLRLAPGLLGAQQHSQIVQGQSSVPAIPQPGPIMNGSGTDIFIGNDPFAAAFNAGSANVNDRAMAEILRLSPRQQAAPSIRGNTEARTQLDASTSTVANGQQQPNPGSVTGRIGVAGFRNDANGLLVMIDIAGLEQVLAAKH